MYAIRSYYAVHPIHSESVAWMAARPDVMVTCAGLAALLAYWHATWSEPKRAGVAAGFVLLGLLCKETAAALLLMVPLSTLILAGVRPLIGAGRTHGTVGATPSRNNFV